MTVYHGISSEDRYHLSCAELLCLIYLFWEAHVWGGMVHCPHKRCAWLVLKMVLNLGSSYVC